MINVLKYFTFEIDVIKPGCTMCENKGALANKVF